MQDIATVWGAVVRILLCWGMVGPWAVQAQIDLLEVWWELYPPTQGEDLWGP